MRSALPKDVPGIVSLYHRTWHESHGPHMPSAERRSRDTTFFLNRIKSLMPNVIVEESDSSIVGFTAWRGAFLGQLFVNSAHRGSGMAGRLMQTAEHRMLQQGASEAELHCLVGNERARRFYEREGWCVCEIVTEMLKGDAGDEGRNFWVMRKALGQTVH